MFLERLTDMVGPSLFRQVKETFVERPTTFRVNTLKHSNIQTLKHGLESQGFKIRQIPWYKSAFVLLNKSKRDLTKTEEYKEGKIYIQSLASMVPPIILDPKPGDTVLDLTAAPGSKTSQIAALMNKEGELVANDINKVRFFKLKANMENLGVSDNFSPYQGELEGVDQKNESISGDGPHPASPNRGGDWEFTLRMEDGVKLCKEYSEPYFDKILLDAVCSSEARFVEGNPKTYGYWKPQKVKQMAYMQQKLLLAAWNVLKPDGELVYSTCTWAPEENESRISKLLEIHSDAKVEKVEIKELKKLPAVMKWKDRKFDKSVKDTLRIMPTKEIEGFFVAKIKKKRLD